MKKKLAFFVCICIIVSCTNKTNHFPISTKQIINDTLKKSLTVIEFTQSKYEFFDNKYYCSQLLCISHEKFDTIRILEINNKAISKPNEYIFVSFKKTSETDTIWIAHDKKTEKYNKKNYPIYYGQITSAED